MNILQIGTIDNSGGAASVSWSIKKELEKRGHKMPMFVAEKMSDNDDVFLIPRNLHHYFHYILSNDIDFAKTDWILDTKEFREADIVHFHNLHGWFFNLKTLEKISKLKPVVWTLHDMWSITPHCAYSFDDNPRDGFYQCPSLSSYPRITWHNEKYLSWRKKNIYNNSNFSLVVPSLWLKEKVSNSILKNKKINLIYNGIDENIFKMLDQTESRKELGIPLNKKIILFLSDGGKNNPLKGWNFIESTIKKFKNDDTVFICLGGEENGKDDRYDNLIYVSRISDKSRLSKYLSASDIFLFPSLADNCPLVILEAMACGAPIVTFNTGGIPELVEHLKGGYVAKYKDSEDLINGINYVLNLSANDLDQMKNGLRQRAVEHFSLNKMVNNYEKLYESLNHNPII